MVHHNLTSNKILLDKQWNPKILDFGITKLLDSKWSSPTMSSPIRVLDEKSDVYRFGTLIMEIISGKTLIFNTATETEVHCHFPSLSCLSYIPIIYFSAMCLLMHAGMFN